MMLMGIDAGNYETKVCVNDNVYSFYSDIGEYRERRLTDSFSKDDIIWEYKGNKGFAGTLARFESEFGGTIKGKSKANSDAVLRILIAVHKYGENNNSIIVGQPIESHIDVEKDKLKKLLLGKHELTINNEKKLFTINHVEIAPEGPAAFLSNPKEGLVRIIDIGSGTINFATLLDLKRIDKDSFTEQIGMETVRNKDPKEMAKKIYRIISATWDINDDIYLTGGGAEKLHQYLNEYLVNCKVFRPRIGNKIVMTKFANAVGFYVIARKVFKDA